MNTTVWLIRYAVDGEARAVVHTHNAIADFRSLDPAATVTVIDCAAVADLIAAAPALIDIAAGRAPVALGVIRRAEAALARCQGGAK